MCLWQLVKSLMGQGMCSSFTSSFFNPFFFYKYTHGNKIECLGSELSGSWIGLDRSSFSISPCVAVRGSDLSGSWIGVDRRYEMWIGARSLFLSVLLCVDRSSLYCCVCVCFVFRFSLLSVLLCVESDPEMNWSENENVNSFPGQRGKLWSTGMQFPENCIFCCNQTCGKGWKWFPEIIFTQNKRSLKVNFCHLKFELFFMV